MTLNGDSYHSAVDVRDLAIEHGLTVIEAELRITLDPVQRVAVTRGLTEVAETWAWHAPRGERWA